MFRSKVKHFQEVSLDASSCHQNDREMVSIGNYYFS